MIFTLEARHCDNGVMPAKFHFLHKGRAIDRMLRELFESTTPEMESYDWYCALPEFDGPRPAPYQEFKSTSKGSITISRSELDLAERKYRDGQDVVYWVCDQRTSHDTFSLEYRVRYSALFENDRLLPSKEKPGDVYFWLNANKQFQC